MLKKNDLIFVAGHNGFVGKAIVRRLKFYQYNNILIINRKKLDLRDQAKTFSFLKKFKPKAIIIAAAKTGGIYLNSISGSDTLYDNLCIQNNLIEGSKRNAIKNIIFLSSNTVYPKDCKQPMKEKYLNTGPLAKSHEYFSTAKLAGMKLCESYSKKYNMNYKTLILPNIYGPNDNYDEKSSSFFPALLKKIYYAKINKKNKIYLWGNGKSKREMIYVDDVADACIFFLKIKTIENVINIGSKKEMSIIQYAKFIMKKFNLNLNIYFKDFRENGMRKKLLDLTIARKYGWKHRVDLNSGFDITLNHLINDIQKSNCKKIIKKSRKDLK
jgi:GDP-L-fucose synthase